MIQQLDQDALTCEEGCVSAGLTDANDQWSQWLGAVQADNGYAAQCGNTVAGNLDQAQHTVDQAAQTATAGLAQQVYNRAVGLAQAHQTWYVNNVQYQTSTSIQIVQQSVNRVSTTIMPGSGSAVLDFSQFVWWSGGVAQLAGVYPPGGTTLVHAAESTAGVGFPGHCWAPGQYQPAGSSTSSGGGGGGSAPGFWSNYYYYLTNPSQMDKDIYYAQTGALVIAGTAGGLAGGLVIGEGIGIIGGMVGANGTATGIAGSLAGSLAGGDIGSGIGGLNGNPWGSFLGGLGGSIAGGAGGGQAAAAAWSAVNSTLPASVGGCPNFSCFVAGTPVLVPGDGDDDNQVMADTSQGDAPKAAKRSGCLPEGW